MNWRFKSENFCRLVLMPRAGQPELNLRIAGIIMPQDFQDPYWLDHFNPFWPLEDTGDTILFGVFVPRESFFSLADAFYPSLDVSYFMANKYAAGSGLIPEYRKYTEHVWRSRERFVGG